MKPTTRILTTLALAGGLSTALFECQAPKRQTLNPEQVHSNLVKTLTMDEGKRQWVYDDETGKRLLPGDKSKGKRTIGVGFNLERGPSAQEQIKSLERDYMKLYKGEASLTDDEINYLLNQDIQDSVADAQKFVGKENYDKLDTRAQEVVINMAFNLGYNGL